MGAYHTVDLELNRKFVLAKECWDAIALERIESACDPSQKADVAAVVMQVFTVVMQVLPLSCRFLPLSYSSLF